MILPEDIEYGHQIGSGNGGVVKLAQHKKLKDFKLAVKIINVYDKEKRHQLYNELKMIKSFGS